MLVEGSKTVDAAKPDLDAQPVSMSNRAMDEICNLWGGSEQFEFCLDLAFSPIHYK